MADERALEGLEHLQAAALEMIAAARAFLDVAEDLVTDPDRVAGTVASWVSMLDLLRRAAAGDPGHRASPDPEAAGGFGHGGAPPARIRRIDLS